MLCGIPALGHFLSREVYTWRSKPRRGKSAGQLGTVYPLAAGIDVGATAHVIEVPPDRDERPMRTFRTFSGDLHRPADWATEVGITTIAM
jgi:transposase